MRGLIRSSSSSNNSLAICIAKDNQMFPFPIDTSETAFVLSLPENYPLNSTTHPRIVVNVQCHIANNTNVNQVGVISNEMNENDARSFSLSLCGIRTLLSMFYRLHPPSKSTSIKLDHFMQ